MSEEVKSDAKRVDEKNQVSNEQDSSQPARKAGQQPVLDACKRGWVCGMVSMGASRRQAAKAIGCHVSTITRTMQRDPQFTRQVQESELHARLRPLQAVLGAMEQH